MKVSVLGAGAWGTALAGLVHRCGMQTTLWAHDPAHIDDLAIYLQVENTRQSRVDRQKIDFVRELGAIVAGLKTEIGVIWGAQDAVAEPVEDGKIVTAMHPRARTAIIPGSGHWVMYEAAAQFNATLLKMLA